MSDLTPSKLDELRRLAATAADATTESTPWYSADDLLTYGVESEDDASYFAALTPSTVLELRDAATELAALTDVDPCDETHEQPYDFAYCKAHDRTFALGDHCDHAGLSAWDYLDGREVQQRGRAVRAEMRAEVAVAERDALSAELAHMREARDNARAEVERLTALVEAVREDARDIARDSGDDKGCYGVDFWAGMCKAAARIDGRIRHALDGEADQ